MATVRISAVCGAMRSVKLLSDTKVAHFLIRHTSMSIFFSLERSVVGAAKFGDQAGDGAGAHGVDVEHVFARRADLLRV